MASTSARMLRLLSLLQTHRYWPGAELADRLEVSPRTVRRDIDRLRELGYPVDATRGTAGGYQLQAGGSLPPLLLEDDEAVAIAVGLQSAARGAVSGIDEIEESAVRALAKLVQVLPKRLRRRVDAIDQATAAERPYADGGTSRPRVDPQVLLVLAQACRDEERVRFRYTAREGEVTSRSVEPHRLVPLGRRWYLVGFDVDKGDWRSFRLDRVEVPLGTGVRFRPRDLPGGDAVAYVQAGIRSMPLQHEVRIRFATPAAELERHVGTWATVVPDGPDACRIEVSADALDWPVMIAAAVGVPFVVESPPALVEQVARLAPLFAAAGSASSQPGTAAVRPTTGGAR